MDSIDIKQEEMLPEISEIRDVPLMEIKHLSKHFGKVKALKDINLRIPRGRIIGLLGKNGAGKSTLMRCMLGFLNYEGEIFYNGVKVMHNDHRMFQKIAFIPDVNALDERLTVGQTIEYISSINPSWNEAKAAKLVKKSNLPVKMRVKALSKGMKTKLYLLIVLSLDVEFLLLDEPTIGLDIVFRREFFNTILGEFYDQNKTILISTHQVDEVEHILQDIIFINEGNILLYEDVDKLKHQYYEIRVPKEQAQELRKQTGMQIWEGLGYVHGLTERKLDIPGAEYDTPQLTDLFLANIGDEDETV